MDRPPHNFSAADLDSRERVTVTVQGARVCARLSGPDTGPGVLLVHGGGASAVWWDAMLGYLSPEHRVAAIDLSGHGESDWRTHYSGELWVAELLTLSDAVGFTGAPVVVGHSLGGALAVAAVAKSPERFAGVVTVDGHPAGPPAGGLRPMPTQQQQRQTWASRATAAERFVSSKPTWPLWFAQHVADRSVTEAEDKWRFLRDRVTLSIPSPRRPDESVTDFSLGFVHGSRSPFLERDLRYVQLHKSVISTVVSGAGHEVLAERPLACAVALEKVTRGGIHCDRQLATAKSFK